MKTNTIATIAAALCLLTAGGRRTASADGSRDDTAILVSAGWLAQRLHDTDVVVIDARGEAAYERGHIPGAVPSSWQDYCDTTGDPGDPGFAGILDRRYLSAKLAARGVCAQRQVVVYGDAQRGFGEEGHLVWLLRVVGVKKSHMLDGGFVCWQAHRLETTRAAAKPRPAAFSIYDIDSTWLATTSFVAHYRHVLRVVDARSAAEYRGKARYGEQRSGHIPDAVSLSFDRVFDRDGTVLPQARLDSLFAGVGLPKGSPIVVYCTSGVRSGLLTIVLRSAGYSQARNYAASMRAWAARDDLPVERH